MSHILFLSIGTFLSFSAIEILFSTSFNKHSILLALAPMILSIVFCSIKKHKSRNLISPISTALVLCLAIIKLTFQYIKFITLDTFTVTAIIYFTINVIFSIASPYAKQNTMFGIRTSVTLKYEIVWEKTHKAFSLISTLFIPFLYTLIFWYNGWTRFILTNAALLIPGLISLFISHIISKPYINADHLKYQEELTKQEKLEEEGKFK